MTAAFKLSPADRRMYRHGLHYAQLQSGEPTTGSKGLTDEALVSAYKATEDRAVQKAIRRHRAATAWPPLSMRDLESTKIKHENVVVFDGSLDTMSAINVQQIELSRGKVGVKSSPIIERNYLNYIQALDRRTRIVSLLQRYISKGHRINDWRDLLVAILQTRSGIDTALWIKDDGLDFLTLAFETAVQIGAEELPPPTYKSRNEFRNVPKSGLITIDEACQVIDDALNSYDPRDVSFDENGKISWRPFFHEVVRSLQSVTNIKRSDALVVDRLRLVSDINNASNSDAAIYRLSEIDAQLDDIRRSFVDALTAKSLAEQIIEIREERRKMLKESLEIIMGCIPDQGEGQEKQIAAWIVHGLPVNLTQSPTQKAISNLNTHFTEYRSGNNIAVWSEHAVETVIRDLLDLFQPPKFGQLKVVTLRSAYSNLESDQNGRKIAARDPHWWNISVANTLRSELIRTMQYLVPTPTADRIEAARHLYYPIDAINELTNDTIDFKSSTLAAYVEKCRALHRIDVPNNVSALHAGAVISICNEFAETISKSMNSLSQTLIDHHKKLIAGYVDELQEIFNSSYATASLPNLLIASDFRDRPAPGSFLRDLNNVRRISRLRLESQERRSGRPMRPRGWDHANDRALKNLSRASRTKEKKNQDGFKIGEFAYAVREYLIEEIERRGKNIEFSPAGRRVVEANLAWCVDMAQQGDIAYAAAEFVSNIRTEAFNQPTATGKR